MDLVSLLITIIGIMALLGLYVMSRVFDQSPAKHSGKSIDIPICTDADGKKLSSVKADIPAQSYTPNHAPAIDYSRHDSSNLSKNSSVNKTSSKKSDSKSQSSAQSQNTTQKTAANNSNNKPSQYVLFIASPSEHQLDGNSIIVAMDHLGFQFGDKDIYHYPVALDSTSDNRNDKRNDNREYKSNKTNLFSVANGVSPWTLKETDLSGKGTPGLSLIMPLPTPIDIKDAITTFIDISEKLAIAINGELQNTQQQIFLPTDKELMLKSAGCT